MEEEEKKVKQNLMFDVTGYPEEKFTENGERYYYTRPDGTPITGSNWSLKDLAYPLNLLFGGKSPTDESWGLEEGSQEQLNAELSKHSFGSWLVNSAPTQLLPFLGGAKKFKQIQHNKKVMKKMKHQERVEDVTGFGDVKIYETVIDDVWNLNPTDARNIWKLKNIQNKGLIKDFTSGSLKKGGLFDPKRNDTTKLMWTSSINPSDIPTYKGSSLDLNTAVHPTTYDGINTINTLLNKHGGFKGARLNLKSYDLKGSLDKRIAATVYFTPYGKGGNFQAIAKREKSIVYQIFGTDLERMGFAPVTEKTKTSPSVQAHHEKAPIKAIVPGFEGIVKESPKYHRFTKLFFDNMLALGDMPENITGVLGHVAKNPDSPHSLTHLFTRYMMGEDGKLFWTQDKLDQIVVYDNEGNAIGTKNDDLREKFMLEQIDLLKDNIKVLENATEQYEILFKQGIQDPATVIEYFEEKLPNLDKEYIRAFAPKILEKFIAEVKAEEEATVLANPVTTSTRNEIIDNIFRRENVKRWRTWDVPVRKARMEEITDGWSFEQIEAFIHAGWLDDERLHELFNPPTEPENLFPDR